MVLKYVYVPYNIGVTLSAKIIEEWFYLTLNYFLFIHLHRLNVWVDLNPVYTVNVSKCK